MSLSGGTPRTVYGNHYLPLGVGDSKIFFVWSSPLEIVFRRTWATGILIWSIIFRATH